MFSLISVCFLIHSKMYILLIYSLLSIASDLTTHMRRVEKLLNIEICVYQRRCLVGQRTSERVCRLGSDIDFINSKGVAVKPKRV